MTSERPRGYCFYPVPTGHLDGSERKCCRSATALFGSLSVCSQHLRAMRADMQQAIRSSTATAEDARAVLRAMDHRVGSTTT